MLDMIVLHAPPKSGKDHVGEYLRTTRENVILAKFAGPFKRGLQEMGLTLEEIEGSLKEVPSARFGGKSPRHVMETVGTLFREYDPDWWPKQLGNLLSMVEEGYVGSNVRPPLVVVTDLRFANEADWAIENGAVTVRIESDGALHLDPAGHVSRVALDPALFDYSLRNDYVGGDPSQIERDIDAVIEAEFGDLYPKRE